MILIIEKSEEVIVILFLKWDNFLPVSALYSLSSF